MNWPLYRSFHARGLNQTKLAALCGINRSVLSRILTNEHGRGKESRVKIFPHLVTAEVDALGWREEYAIWWEKTTGQILPPKMEQSSTGNIAPCALAGCIVSGSHQPDECHTQEMLDQNEDAAMESMRALRGNCAICNPQPRPNPDVQTP